MGDRVAKSQTQSLPGGAYDLRSRHVSLREAGPHHPVASPRSYWPAVLPGRVNFWEHQSLHGQSTEHIPCPVHLHRLWRGKEIMGSTRHPGTMTCVRRGGRNPEFFICLCPLNASHTLSTYSLFAPSKKKAPTALLCDN